MRCPVRLASTPGGAEARGVMRHRKRARSASRLVASPRARAGSSIVLTALVLGACALGQLVVNAPVPALAGTGSEAEPSARTVGTSCSPRLGNDQCSDGNPCTADSCSDNGVCVHTPDDSATCDDADACTKNERCVGGQCTGGARVHCDDDNVCTDDTCEPTSGCVHTPNAAPCDDGDLCTQGDTCVTGTCSGGYPVICTARSQCHAAGTCNPASGLCLNPPAPDGTACDDYNICTSGDMCIDGRCMGGAPRDCDDANECTDDDCDAIAGCVHEPNRLPCNDGSACTTNDVCTRGRCVGGPSFNCEDDNPCTDDACDPTTGCVHSPNTLPCDDGDACTTEDACQDGHCTGGRAIECDDGDDCTTDGCDSAIGCTHTRNGACGENEDASPPDACAAGCDDGNPCTDDACDPALGCVHTARGQACEADAGTHATPPQAESSEPAVGEAVRSLAFRTNGHEKSRAAADGHIWKVQLAAVRTSRGATREWERLRRVHDDVVGDLTLSVERADLGPGKGIYYRVQAGSFPDKDSAAAVCSAMSQRNAGCMVVSGN